MALDVASAPPPALFRLRDAVRFSGFSRSTLYKLASHGKITMRKAGRTTLVDAASLSRAIEALPVAAIGPQRRRDAAPSVGENPTA